MTESSPLENLRQKASPSTKVADFNKSYGSVVEILR